MLLGDYPWSIFNEQRWSVFGERQQFESLKRQLAERGYASRVGADIHPIHGAFEDQAESVCEFVNQKSPRTGRSIFLLDQYGYSDVPTSIIRAILGRLPRAEIILTFAVDALINYANDDRTAPILERLGLSAPDLLRGRSFADVMADPRAARLWLQSALYHGLVNQCGAQHWTLFFIRTSGHGDYWLVHLSQVPRARDVMTQVHWAHNNHFIHYGGAGLDMFQVLGYDPSLDERVTGQSTLGFCFDQPAEDQTVAALVQQLPRLIYANEVPATFREIYQSVWGSSQHEGNFLS